MILHFILSSTPSPFLKMVKGRPRLDYKFDGHLHGEPMMVEWKGQRSYCATAMITLSESDNVIGVGGTIGFNPKWTNEEDGTSYPGYPEIWLPTPKVTFDFIESQLQRGETLCISIELIAPIRVLSSIGPDEYTECRWIVDPKEMPIATLRELFPVARKAKSPETPVNLDAKAHENQERSHVTPGLFEKSISIQSAILMDLKRQSTFIKYSLALHIIISIILLWRII